VRVCASLAAAAGGLCEIKPAGALTITGVGRANFNTSPSTAEQLSGITYISGNQYYLVDDHATTLFPATLNIDLNTGALNGVSFSTPFQLNDANGSALLSANTDLEGVAYNPAHNSFYVSDEKGPTIREHSALSGNQTLLMNPTTPANPPQLQVFANIRSNQSWESMGRQMNGVSAYTMNQAALTVDGNTSTLLQGGLIRLQKFDASMNPAGQWGYQLDANDAESNWTSLTSSCVSDVLVMPDGQVIALERAIGQTNSNPSQIRIRLYGINTTGATNLNGGSIAGATLVTKTLYWETFLPAGQNNQFEGLTLGPQLSNGDWSIILCADNSGGTSQTFYTLRASGMNVPASTWATNSNATWSASGNWTGSGPPCGIMSIATFGSAINAPRTVAIDANQIASTLNFDNANRYTLAGAGTITLDSASPAAAINVSNGSHTISAPLVMNKNTTVTITNANSTLSMSGNVSAAAGVTLSKLGAGALEMNNVRADGLSIGAGTLRILANGSSGGTSVVSSLSITGGNLDLNDNSLIISYGTNAAPLSSVRQYLKNGRNAGAGAAAPWNGAGGIISTYAHNNGNGFNLAIGYANNADLASASSTGSYTSFGGMTVGSNAVLVRMTYGADANLDGVVDGSDVAIIGTHFGKPNSGQWYYGDFDYSGTCDGSDVAVLGTSFGKTSPVLSPAQMTAEFGSAFTAALESGQSAGIPEPAGVVWMVLGSGILFGKDQRLRYDCRAHAQRKGHSRRARKCGIPNSGGAIAPEASPESYHRQQSA